MAQPRIKMNVGREMRRIKAVIRRRPAYMTMLVLNGGPDFELFTNRDQAAKWAERNLPEGSQVEFVDKVVRG